MIDVNVGEIVRVTACVSHHGFEIGEKVRVLKVYRITEGSDEPRLKAEHLDSSDYWWLNDGEFESTKAVI